MTGRVFHLTSRARRNELIPTLLITGGCGFLGANFIRWQLPTYADQQIVNIDKLTYAGNPENLADVASDSRYLFVHGDICDREFVDRVLKDHKPELVVNFAAESHVDRSILDSGPFVRTNIVGTQVLMDACRAVGVPGHSLFNPNRLREGSVGRNVPNFKAHPLAVSELQRDSEFASAEWPCVLQSDAIA